MSTVQSADKPTAVSTAECERCASDARRAPSTTAWGSLTPLQRYALTKLAKQRNSRNWNEALAEFGLGDNFWPKS